MKPSIGLIRLGDIWYVMGLIAARSSEVKRRNGIEGLA